MADNKVYITSGLPVAKDSGQTPSGNSVYITSGLPAEVLVAVGQTTPIISAQGIHNAIFSGLVVQG